MSIKFDTFKAGGGGAGTDNLDDVTSRGATTTNAITVGGVTVGTEYSLPAADGSPNQYLKTDGAGTLSFAALDVTGGLVYQGAFNATAGTPSIANAEKGDFYVIDTAGTLYGQDWNVGDHLLINEDMGGTITNSKIDKIDNTETPASETVAGVIEIATNLEAQGATLNNKALVPSNISSIALSSFNDDLSYLSSGDNISLLTNDSGYLTSVPSASETVEGIIETATNLEAQGASVNNKALVPSNISSIALSSFNDDLSYLSSGDNVSLLTNDAGYLTSVSSASETVEGIIETATNLEAQGATVNNKALVPSNISSIALSSFNDDLSYLSSGDNVSLLTNDAGYLTSVSSASETVEGIIETATNLEAQGATVNNKALVPSNISSIALSSFNDDLSYLSSGDNVSLLTNDAGYLTSVSSASETVAGVIEIATNLEAQGASATDKALVPSNISSIALSSFNDDLSYLSSGDNVSLLTNDAGYLTSVSSASETVEGIIEIATNLEAQGASATDKALVPSNISSIALSSFNDDLSYLSSGDDVSLLTNDSGYLTGITSESLGDLSDVTITSPSNGQVLQYDSGSFAWINAAASGGGSAPAITSVSQGTDYTISHNSSVLEDVYIITPSADINVNLPAAATCGSGYKYTIKNLSATYILTVDPNSTETIDGDLTYDINVENQSLTIVSDATNNKWYII